MRRRGPGRRVHSGSPTTPELPLDAFELKLLLHPLLALPTLPLLVAAAGLWLARRRPRAGLAIAASALAVAWLLATPWAADRLAAAVEDGQQPFEAAAWPALRDGPDAPGA
ncbi:MAG: hypothetical protein WCK28_20280, partial [Burkholderiales bacterium]